MDVEFVVKIERLSRFSAHVTVTKYQKCKKGDVPRLGICKRWVVSGGLFKRIEEKAEEEAEKEILKWIRELGGENKYEYKWS